MTLPARCRPGHDRPRPRPASGGDEARLDAVMLEPLVSRYVLGGDGHGTALLRSAASTTAHTSASPFPARAGDGRVYDGRARLRPPHAVAHAPCR